MARLAKGQRQGHGSSGCRVDDKTLSGDEGLAECVISWSMIHYHDTVREGEGERGRGRQTDTMQATFRISNENFLLKSKHFVY